MAWLGRYLVKRLAWWLVLAGLTLLVGIAGAGTARASHNDGTVNLVRTPTSGTATYTADSSYSGGFGPGNAADGSTGTDWAHLGACNTGTCWWRVTWSVAQDVTRVRVAPRGSDWVTPYKVKFSDGYDSGAHTITGSGIRTMTLDGAVHTATWMEVYYSGTGAQGFDPGWAEVEAYYDEPEPTPTPTGTAEPTPTPEPDPICDPYCIVALSAEDRARLDGLADQADVAGATSVAAVGIVVFLLTVIGVATGLRR